MKKILLMFLSFICILYALSFAYATINSLDLGLGSLLFLMMISVGFFALAIFLWKKAKKIPSKAEKQAAAEKQLAQKAAALRELENNITSMTTLPIIDSEGVILNPDEVCHYQQYARAVKISNIVTGYSGGSAGLSVRVAKGVTLHSGNSNRTPIRKNVANYYPGLLTITNKRIIMTGEKGFDKPINKLTAITPYSDGVELQFGSSNYSIAIPAPQPLMVNKIIELLLIK